MNASPSLFAQLSPQQLARIQQLETQLDSWLVAVQPDARLASPPDLSLASVSDRQLADLQQSEQALGVILLAYQPVRPN